MDMREHLAEEDKKPTNPKLWEKCKETAKGRYTKWPSAYAVGHALKLYKDEGGGWKKTAREGTKIDPAWVNGIRAWVKKTFAPKSRYASLDDLIAHFKSLRDKDLNRFWEYLFFTKGLLPLGIDSSDSIFEMLGLKVRDELEQAKYILDGRLGRFQHVRDAMTPGTQTYTMDGQRILGFYQRVNPDDPFAAALRGYEEDARDTLSKVEGILSGKLLRAITRFLTRFSAKLSGSSYDPSEILLEFNIGKVKLVYDGVSDPNLIHRLDPANPRALFDYIPFFKKAKALLDQKGFGALWYGPIFVGCPECGGENPLGKHFGIGAHYYAGLDRVVVYLKPKPFLVELLVHELGHRYYFKFMDAGDRARFDSYYKEVAAVSEYGGTHTAEDFAEVFAHFVLGRDMTRDQIERFKAFLAKKDSGRFASAMHVASLYLSAKGKAKKDVGHGGLDEWFSGHGQGKGKAPGEAQWGDWVAISPVKRTITREDGTKKTYEPGDIIGPCGDLTNDPDWKDLTRGGKTPFKCMARPKAHDMPKGERADKAREKMKAQEKAPKGKKPVNTPTFVSARFAAKNLDLSDYGLEGLTTGAPVTLYHGTSASYTKFDLAKNRDELVNKFYGRGIFLTPSKRVAWKYAQANRNMGLPVSVIDDLSRVNRNAGSFLRALHEEGQDAWESYWKANGFWRDNPAPGVGKLDMAGFEKHLGGVDSNTLLDISKHIEGTAYRGQASPDGIQELMDLFSDGGTGSPSWLYDNLDTVGLDSTKYRPKVLTVVVRVNNPLVTASKSEARKASSKGYDAVVYHGSDLVGGEVEVAVYDASKTKITHVET